MSERLQAIRGMNDILPADTFAWRQLERALIDCVYQYDYQEIRLPFLEKTLLFKRTIGEVTDVVEKEMYTFADLNGDSLSLRPEGTAGCVRACIEHGLLNRSTQRLWYMGPMFRHERPQKGRYRQFVQFGLEALGFVGTGIELEILSFCKRLWQNLGILESLTLEVNYLGTSVERSYYREQLITYFETHIDSLDEDSKRRLHRNPLRILDSKNPEMQSVISKAPAFRDHMGAESNSAFDALLAGLDTLGIRYQLNPRLVRGLDYYNGLVFEWTTGLLGSQATVCGGGRYDSLVEQLGGPAVPAIGFSMGVERVLLMMEQLNNISQPEKGITGYFVVENIPAQLQAYLIAEQLRSLNKNWCFVVNAEVGSFKSQFKKADKSGAAYALVLGETEISEKMISIKDLKMQQPQIMIPVADLGKYLQNKC